MSTEPQQPQTDASSEARGPSALDRIAADPTLRSRDDDGVAAIAIGTVLWTMALIALVAFGDRLAGLDVDRWILVCAIGAGLGIPGLAIVLARRARLRRRAA